MTPIPTLYSALTQQQVKHIHRTIEPYHSFLLPSIVHLWYNHNDQAMGFHTDTFSLGQLHPSADDNFLTISTSAILDHEQIADMRQHISGTTHNAIRHSAFLLTQDSSDISVDFTIEKDDPKHYDYIYDVNKLAACEGKKYEDTRRHVRKFFDLYRSDLKIKTIDGWSEIAKHQTDAFELFDDWTHYSTEGSATYHDELRALELFFARDPSQLFGKIVSTLFFYKDRLVGYSINEIFNDTMAVNHFHKANLNLSSIGHYMFYSVAKILADQGVSYLNFQEDCGIGGLRAFKHKMRPVKMFETKKVTYLTR